MICPQNRSPDENLHRWEASGRPRQWVEAHCGHWEHADWLLLLGNLRHSEFWPLEPVAVGELLERLKRERASLRLWVESGQPRWWVESHRGAWGHDDWLSLLDALRESEFWPLEPTQVGAILEEHKTEWINLQRWREAGQARLWVESRQGVWNHQDWLSLIETLPDLGFWPMNLEALGAVLEQEKERYRKLNLWVESGRAHWWVVSRRGHWDHRAWLDLLDSMQESGFWPVYPDAVGSILEKLARDWREGREAHTRPRLWAGSQAKEGGRELDATEIADVRSFLSALRGMTSGQAA
jgi:hypothetical protein